ncbi:MAG TPA: MFS transporter [Microbacterium sp.]|nr:MFS transporter [Microbacterium sp.]
MSATEPTDTGLIDIGGGGMFRSLRVRNFRIWFFGALASSMGAWMQATAMGWVVLTELTDGDAAAMGVAIMFQALPGVVLIPVVGRVVDRFERRTMLVITSSLFSVLALALGTLLVLDVLLLPHMFVFTAIWGIIMAFDQPLRQSFIGDIVRPDKIVNAISLSSVQFNVARLTGPALAGVLIGVIGSGWIFILNTVTYLALVVSLVAMRRAEFSPRLRDASSASMRAAVRYVRHRSDILLLLGMVLISSAFVTQFAIYAAAMAVSFGQPAWAFGLVTSCYAVGSLTGALFLARMRVVRMRRIVLFALLVALATALSASMPDFWSYAVAGAACGFTIVTLMGTANAYMQAHTDPMVRGRVLVMYMAAFTGGAPVGAPLIGLAANAWGARGAVFLVAVMAFVMALVGIVWYLSTGRVHRRAERRFRLSLDATRPITLPTTE